MKQHHGEHGGRLVLLSDNECRANSQQLKQGRVKQVGRLQGRRVPATRTRVLAEVLVL
jgi:hypothetical protein